MLACLLFSGLHKASTDPFATPIREHSQRINIPFIVRGLAFEPPSGGSVEAHFVSATKTQHQPYYLCILFSNQGALVAKTVTILTKKVLQPLAKSILVFCWQRIGYLRMSIRRIKED